MLHSVQKVGSRSRSEPSFGPALELFFLVLFAFGHSKACQQLRKEREKNGILHTESFLNFLLCAVFLNQRECYDWVRIHTSSIASLTVGLRVVAISSNLRLYTTERKLENTKMKYQNEDGDHVGKLAFGV